MHIIKFNQIRDKLNNHLVSTREARDIALALLQIISISDVLDYGDKDAEVVRILKSKGYQETASNGRVYLAKIAAIKNYREMTGAGLKEAKEHVENIIWKLENNKYTPKKAPKNPKKSPKQRLRQRVAPKSKAKKRKAVV